MPPVNHNNPQCPYCGSPSRKHGRLRDGTQRYQCSGECGRNFTRRPPRQCVVCGMNVPRERGNKNTCCMEHEAEKKRRICIEYYYRATLSNPEHNKHLYSMKKQKADYADKEKAAARAKWQRIKSNTERYEAEKERLRSWYAEHREEVQAKRRERLRHESVEDYIERIARMRERSRVWRAQHVAALKADPEAYALYVKKRREWFAAYRQRIALSRLLKISDELKKKIEDEQS